MLKFFGLLICKQDFGRKNKKIKVNKNFFGGLKKYIFIRYQTRRKRALIYTYN
jgi:hypothetical protein